MPESPLLKEFMAKLQNSLLFRALGDKEKAFLLNSYQNASDEQIRKSMDLLEKDDADMKKTVIKNYKTEEKTAGEHFADIGARYAELKKITLKEENEKDINESSQKADELLAAMNQTKTAVPEKKKGFLGLF